MPHETSRDEKYEPHDTQISRWSTSWDTAWGIPLVSAGRTMDEYSMEHIHNHRTYHGARHGMPHELHQGSVHSMNPPMSPPMTYPTTGGSMARPKGTPWGAPQDTSIVRGSYWVSHGVKLHGINAPLHMPHRMGYPAMHCVAPHRAPRWAPRPWCTQPVGGIHNPWDVALGSSMAYPHAQHNERRLNPGDCTARSDGEHHGVHPMRKMLLHAVPHGATAVQRRPPPHASWGRTMGCIVYPMGCIMGFVTLVRKRAYTP